MFPFEVKTRTITSPSASSCAIAANISAHFDLGKRPFWKNAYLMQRYFVHMDLHLSDRFRFFRELASSLETGGNSGPQRRSGRETAVRSSGFFRYRPLAVRQRQPHLASRTARVCIDQFGELRFHSWWPLNIRRSLDGFRLTWVKGDWTIDTFAMRPTLDNPGNFQRSTQPRIQFLGRLCSQAICRFLPEGNVDLYYFVIDLQNVRYDSLQRIRPRAKGNNRDAAFEGTTEHWDYNNDEFTYRWGWFGPD